ncbi:hypothetical protein HCJ39_07120 [Listeria rocourtiae]|uniref:hypothetical protein n=1 Tax=Listeria rocourtiae TaxID=647910 RepID=UPI001626446C|nr:hypothetical protein [Listeria rocourtiae]MBC1604481.1 hypothetical protein [Listeria rocourtiae]
MQNEASWLDKKRDQWELIQAKFKRKQSIYYRLSSLFIVLGFVFFLFSQPILGGEEVVKSTPLGEKMELEDMHISMYHRQVNASGDMAQFDFVIALNMDTEDVKKLSFTVQEKNNQGVNLPAKMIKGDANFYVLLVKDIPTDWSVMQIRINEAAIDDGDEAVFLMARNDMKKSTTVAWKSTRDVEIEAVDYRIALVEKEIKQLEKDGQKERKNIAKLETEIQEKEAGKRYEIAEDIVITDAEIGKLQTDIDNAKQGIETLKAKIKEQEERKEKLKLKKSDIRKTAS